MEVQWINFINSFYGSARRGGYGGGRRIYLKF